MTYKGVGGTKKWERIESYGPKFVENIVQAVSRDILAYAMRTLSHCFICGHVHDELIIECGMGVSLEVVCEQMGRTPPWIRVCCFVPMGMYAAFTKKIKKIGFGYFGFFAYRQREITSSAYKILRRNS